MPSARASFRQTESEAVALLLRGSFLLRLLKDGVGNRPCIFNKVLPRHSLDIICSHFVYHVEPLEHHPPIAVFHVIEHKLGCEARVAVELPYEARTQFCFYAFQGAWIYFLSF